MSDTRITATDLAHNLSDVLDRAHDHRERFIVERNGRPVAALVPVEDAPGMTLAEFYEYLRDRGLPDEKFGQDLEAIQAEQPKAEVQEWPC